MKPKKGNSESKNRRESIARPIYGSYEPYSWLNALANFFSKLTRQRIRRGSFHSIVDLQAAIKRYLAEHNAEPKPFVWNASAASILAKLDRLKASSV